MLSKLVGEARRKNLKEVYARYILENLNYIDPKISVSEKWLEFEQLASRNNSNDICSFLGSLLKSGYKGQLESLKDKNFQLLASITGLDYEKYRNEEKGSLNVSKTNGTIYYISLFDEIIFFTIDDSGKVRVTNSSGEISNSDELTKLSAICNCFKAIKNNVDTAIRYSSNLPELIANKRDISTMFPLDMYYDYWIDYDLENETSSKIRLYFSLTEDKRINEYDLVENGVVVTQNMKGNLTNSSLGYLLKESYGLKAKYSNTLIKLLKDIATDCSLQNPGSLPYMIKARYNNETYTIYFSMESDGEIGAVQIYKDKINKSKKSSIELTDFEKRKIVCHCLSAIQANYGERVILDYSPDIFASSDEPASKRRRSSSK